MGHTEMLSFAEHVDSTSMIVYAKKSTDLELSDRCDPLTLFESVRHSECLLSLGAVRSDRLDPKAIRVRYDAGIEALCIVVYR